jgi:hypothetical protein
LKWWIWKCFSFNSCQMWMWFKYNRFKWSMFFSNVIRVSWTMPILNDNRIRNPNTENFRITQYTELSRDIVGVTFRGRSFEWNWISERMCEELFVSVDRDRKNVWVRRFDFIRIKRYLDDSLRAIFKSWLIAGASNNEWGNFDVFISLSDGFHFLYIDIGRQTMIGRSHFLFSHRKYHDDITDKDGMTNGEVMVSRFMSDVAL